jgi:cytoskeleton protein RodZ
MNMDPVQNPLFKEPVGASFRNKREKLGLSIEDAAKSLKFGSHLVQAIEDEHWDKLGPAIYARSYVSSYIKLLGLNEAIKNEIPTLSSGSVPLKTITQARVEPAGIQSKSILALVTLLGLAALAAVLYFRSPPVDVEIAPIDNSIPLSMPATEPSTKAAADATAASLPATPAVTQPADAVGPTATGPNVQPATIAATPQFTLRAKTDTWLEIIDVNGQALFKELIPAGQERTQALGNVGKITVGKAGSAEFLINGGKLDLSPYAKNDVARFTVDGSGNPAAISP